MPIGFHSRVVAPAIVLLALLLLVPTTAAAQGSDLAYDTMPSSMAAPIPPSSVVFDLFLGEHTPQTSGTDSAFAWQFNVGFQNSIPVGVGDRTDSLFLFFGGRVGFGSIDADGLTASVTLQALLDVGIEFFFTRPTTTGGAGFALLADLSVGLSTWLLQQETTDGSAQYGIIGGELSLRLYIAPDSYFFVGPHLHHWGALGASVDGVSVPDPFDQLRLGVTFGYGARF